MMPAFDVSRTSDEDIILCRIYRFLADSEAELLVAALSPLITTSRRHHRPIRMLFDNRQGAVFSAKAAHALMLLREARDDRDRTAVLVSDNINKLQAKRTAGPGTEVFVSEPEAMQWLQASA